MTPMVSVPSKKWWNRVADVAIRRNAHERVASEDGHNLRWLPKFGLVALATIAAGCASNPITTSLTDLTAESRTRKTFGADYREIVSLTGSLHMPTVGLLNYYPEPPWYAKLFGAKSPNPNHLIAFSNEWPDRSYRLTMTTADDPGLASAVSNVVCSVEKIQRAVAEGVRLRVELAAVDAQLTQTNAVTVIANDLATAHTKLAVLIESNDVSLTSFQADFIAAKSHPGIIVARWTMSSEAGGAVEASDVVSLSGRHKKSQSGYLVLGGLRTSMLFFGRDFQAFLLNMGTSDYHAFRRFGTITTYVLQSKYIAYTTELDVEDLVRFYLSLDPKQLGTQLKAIDRVKIAGYAALSRNLSNAGNIGNVVWEKEPIRFADLIVTSCVDDNQAYLSEKTLAPPREGEPGKPEFQLIPITNDIRAEAIGALAPTSVSGLLDSLVQPNKVGSWKTVYAVIAKAPRVFDAMRQGLTRSGENWPASITNCMPAVKSPK